MLRTQYIVSHRNKIIYYFFKSFVFVSKMTRCLSVTQLRNINTRSMTNISIYFVMYLFNPRKSLCSNRGYTSIGVVLEMYCICNASDTFLLLLFYSLIGREAQHLFLSGSFLWTLGDSLYQDLYFVNSVQCRFEQ